jgi:small subunit ribosomal protein S18
MEVSVQQRNKGRNVRSVRPVRTLRENTECRFCRDKVKLIDYKDIEVLQKLLTQRGKIFSRKRSGNCAGCQRKVQNAVKRARYIGLLPFVN